MDTIQILNIDIPVKAYKIKNDNELKSILKKEAINYLKNCCNYFANGVLYPKTLEVLDFKPGIKAGSTLGDEMVFNTNVKGCFRLYPINTIHEGIITDINSVNIKINNEYMYNINIPIVKSNEEIEVLEGKKNNKMSIYISSEVKYEDLHIGDTVQFQIVDLSSKFNNNSISIIGYLIKKINTYSKQYQTNDNKTLIDDNIYEENLNENLMEFIKRNLPEYYKCRDVHYINTNIDYDKTYFTKGNDQNKYKLFMTNSLNILNTLSTGDILCYFGNVNDYNNLIDKFANINIYKFYYNDKFITIFIGSYYI